MYRILALCLFAFFVSPTFAQQAKVVSSCGGVTPAGFETWIYRASDLSWYRIA